MSEMGAHGFGELTFAETPAQTAWRQPLPTFTVHGASRALVLHSARRASVVSSNRTASTAITAKQTRVVITNG